MTVGGQEQSGHQQGGYEQGARAAWFARFGGGRQAMTYLMFRMAGTVLCRAPEPVASSGAFVASQILAARPKAAGSPYVGHVAKVLGRPVSEAEGHQWTRRMFANYARYWREGARLPALPGAVIDERMAVERGFQHLEQAMTTGRGAIVALPHLGGWEWGGAWLARQGYPMTAVAEVLQPAALYEWFVAQRAAMGIQILPLGPGASGELVRVLSQGGLVGLVADRDLTGGGVPVEFFGERTTLPGGPATLALRTGAALLPTAVYLGPGPMHTAVIEPPVEAERTGRLRADVIRVTQALAGAFEGLIRRAPDQWYSLQPMWPSDGQPSVGADATPTATAEREQRQAS